MPLNKETKSKLNKTTEIETTKTDFNGMSTPLGLFDTKRLGNHVY